MPPHEYFQSKEFILLYFSAGWCPPCRAFSPKLSKWARENKESVGVFFVSHDESEREMLKFVDGKHFSFAPFRDPSFR